MNDAQEIMKGIGMEKILDDIQNNKCILFLGPLMATVEHKGKVSPLSEIYSEQLLEELKPANIIFDQEVKRNPYFLNSKYSVYAGGRANLEKKLKNYFNVFINSSSSAYDSLSKLPFNTIINFGSDRLMQNALNKNGYEFSDKYYNYKGTYSQYLEGLDDNLQLVYNLLGSVNDINSQILTEEDQLLFMRSIVSGPKLPDNVLSRIQDPDDSKSYIFLGFNFEDWPFRFLLDVLQLPKTKRSVSPRSPNYNIAFMTKEFYQEKFGLKFVDLDPEIFANSLVSEYLGQHTVDKHRNGFIAYHEYDSKTFDEFNIHLNNSKLGKRIKFWNKSQTIASEITEEVLAGHLNTSTIYIPLVSSRFLNDPLLSNQFRTMLEREDTLIFPIIVSNCDYESDFTNIKLRSSLILPTDDKVLINSTEPVLPGDYISMIKKINSKIR